LVFKNKNRILASHWRKLENISIIKCDYANGNIQGYSLMEDASPVNHRKRMEEDFIRLIEEKQQEN
jgi:hypothetical protein